VDTVIATANTVVPSGRYSFESVERQGYQNLIDAGKRHGLRQFIFMSVPVTPLDDKVPTFRYKRLNEQRIQQSGISYTIVRGSLFMDDWLALIGSSIPLRGADVHTLRRPFWFSNIFLKGVGTLIEDRGLALVPGDGKTRHALVMLDDVAAFIVKAVGHPQAHDAILEVGGPEILSWDEAVGIFSKVLGRPVRALHAPAGVFRLQQQLLGPFSPAAANLMGMNWIVATVDTPYDMRTLALAFGVELTSVERFLRERVPVARA
jgi:NADH dehydrogenase